MSEGKIGKGKRRRWKEIGEARKGRGEYRRTRKTEKMKSKERKEEGKKTRRKGRTYEGEEAITRFRRGREISREEKGEWK